MAPCMHTVHCTVGYEHRHDSKPEFQSPSPGFNPYGNANVCECAKLGAILFIIYGLSFPRLPHSRVQNIYIFIHCCGGLFTAKIGSNLLQINIFWLKSI